MIKKLLSFLIPLFLFSTAHAELPSTLTDREMQKFRQTSDGLVSINAVIAPGSTINTTGNITGAYFIGNGSQLTGVIGGNYTNEEAQDSIATLIQNATGITWTYNDTANTLTPAVTGGGGNYTITNATSDTGWTHASGKAYPTVIGDNIGIGLSDPVAPLTVKGDGNTTGRMMQLQSSTGVDRLTVLDNGNVGIGTTAPGVFLDVAGSIRGTGVYVDGGSALYGIDANGVAYIGATNNDYFHLVTNGTKRISISNTGSVGIGTTAPVGKLDVVTAGTTGTIALRVGDTSGTGRIAILDNAKIGIGTTAPSQALDVVGTINASVGINVGANAVLDKGTILGETGDVTGPWNNLQIVAGTVGPSELASTAVTAGVYGSASLSPVITVDADGRVTNVTNATITGTGASTLWNSTGTNIYNNGSFTKVGIGTSAPNVNLVVVGDANITGNLTVSGNLTYPGNVSAIYFTPYDQSIRGDTDAYALNFTSNVLLSDGNLNAPQTGQTKGFILEGLNTTGIRKGTRLNRYSTMNGLFVRVDSGTSFTGQLMECNATGASCVNCNATNVFSAGYTAITSFTDAIFDDGDYWAFNITAVSGPINGSVTIQYDEDFP